MMQVQVLNLMWRRVVIQITNTAQPLRMEEHNAITQHLLLPTVAHLVVAQALAVVAEVVQVADLVNLRS